MCNKSELLSWEWLEEFGFQADTKVISDIQPGLSYQLKNLKLAASATVSRSFHPIILFTGLFKTDRRLSQIIFEIPQNAMSKELCAAYISFCLKEQFGKHINDLADQHEWIKLGLAHNNLLPWEAKRIQQELEEERFRQRPLCSVDREYLKLAVKDLRAQLRELQDDAYVTIKFDGSLLTIIAAGQPIVVVAMGSAWPSEYQTKAIHLSKLPKRLMSPVVDVSIWKDTLMIDRSYRYKGILIKE